METVKEQPQSESQNLGKPAKRNIALEMLDRKRRIQAYLISGDESEKPADVRFVTPFDIPTDEA